MKSAKFIVSAICALYLACGGALATQTIDAWNYYASPPFLTDPANNAGLSSDLVAYLNKALAGKYDIRLVLLPRARLQMMLDRGDKAFVLFAPSVIFGGVDGGRYLWTAPLFNDRQELVSRKEHPFEFNGPASLFGVRLGAMVGHVYPMLAKEIEAGQIRPERSTNEVSLVKMLMLAHVDVITLANSSISYLMSNDAALKENLRFSKQNLGEYTRNLMFQQGMEKERDDFDRVVRTMDTNPVWITTLKKYGLEPASKK